MKQARAKVFSNGKAMTDQEIPSLMNGLGGMLDAYPFDQYRHYPSKNPDAWKGFLVSRLESLMENPEWAFFITQTQRVPIIVGCRVSKWDEEHFGFKMASLHYFLGGTDSTTDMPVAECLEYFRGQGVKFVSARINGDNVGAIHSLESGGFRYYENIIWPVLKCTAAQTPSGRVRLMAPEELDRVAEIAGISSFQRSHFHSDLGFNREKVNSMPEKWIRTASGKGDPIAVMECDGTIAGYFAFAFDESLSKALGYRYARMRHLGLDPAFRGKGHGKLLFDGTIALMHDMGAEYVDSGYASKNHRSARLHSQNMFHSVYEEVTLHKWV